MRASGSIAGLRMGWVLVLLVARPTTPDAGELLLEASSDRVGRYERLEFKLKVPGKTSNPYDPDEVDVRIVVTPPSGPALELPAFFIQEFERQRPSEGRRARDWIYPVGEGSWHARFAPRETGEYLAVARLRTRSESAESARIRFVSTPSTNKGTVRVSETDPRFFEYDDGSPFFAVGQDLAFIGEGQYVTLSRAEEILEKLSRHGANYVRIWTCCEDWALALEARKSAWGRSWGGGGPVVVRPGSEAEAHPRRCVRIVGDDGSALAISPSHTVALRPETRYVLSGEIRTDGTVGVTIELLGHLREAVAARGSAAEWRPFRLEFRTQPAELWMPRTIVGLDGKGTAWLDRLSLREEGRGAELLWEADVNRSLPGTYNQVDAFLLDQVVEAAEEHGVYLQLCLLTRDLYMGELQDPDSVAYRHATRHAKSLLRYAAARWGYSTSVVTWEYFNEMDPGRPTDSFYTALGEELEEADPYRHLRATSTWHPSPRDWMHPKLDVADEHFYLRPGKDAQYSDEVEAVLGCAKLIRESAPRKPALLSEFGLATERWGLSPRMKQDADLVHVHNALWASALSGLSGTTMFWWWEELDRMDVYPIYKPLAAFVADIPYSSGSLEPLVANAVPDRIRVIGLRADDRAYLWLFDRDAAWVGKGLEGVVPGESTGVAFALDGLSPGDYRVTWFDTRSGDAIRTETLAAGGGSTRLSPPTFRRDIACKLVPP